MAHMDDPDGSSEQGPMDGEWLSDYASAQRRVLAAGGQSGFARRRSLGRRSLQDGEWTVDTVTADLIEGWEEITPLFGEGIELWLELVQRTMSRADDG